MSSEVLLAEIVKFARDFAEEAHKDQTYDDYPYVYHLDQVVSILANYSSPVQAIGYLHDCLEDTDKTLEMLRKAFNSFVADCVEIVTDPEGKNRKERKQKLYARLSKIDRRSVYQVALIVKLADRLANVRHCVETENLGLLKMYQREHKAFKKAVYRYKVAEEMQEELDYLLEGSEV